MTSKRDNCQFRHYNIDQLIGVPPTAIDDLPTVCACGAPITYADEVAFVNQVNTVMCDHPAISITPFNVSEK